MGGLLVRRGDAERERGREREREREVLKRAPAPAAPPSQSSCRRRRLRWHHNDRTSAQSAQFQPGAGSSLVCSDAHTSASVYGFLTAPLNRLTGGRRGAGRGVGVCRFERQPSDSWTWDRASGGRDPAPEEERVPEAEALARELSDCSFRCRRGSLRALRAGTMRPNRGFLLLLLNGTACLVSKECVRLLHASPHFIHPIVRRHRAPPTSRFKSKRARKLTPRRWLGRQADARSASPVCAGESSVSAPPPSPTPPRTRTSRAPSRLPEPRREPVRSAGAKVHITESLENA